MVQTFAHLFTPRVSNNRRPKIIHPEGFLVLSGIALLTHLLIRVLPFSIDSGSILGYASNITQVEVVQLTNQRRTAQGLQPVSLNDKLSLAAYQKAQHMFENQYWAHFAPDGTTPWQFIKQQGYVYTAAGENLAKDFGDTPSMVQAWMDSKTHRENLLNSKYSEIGVAVVNGELHGVETTLVVQMFGSPSGGSATVQAPTTQSPVPAPLELQQPSVISVADEVVVDEVVPDQLDSEQPTLDVEQTPYPAALQPDAVRGLETELREFFSLMNPLRISKALFFSMLALLLFVLMYDFEHASSHQLVRVVGKNTAHITLLIVLLLIVLMVDQGKLL